VRQLIYLASARQDFLDIQRYIARESGHLSVARRFVAQLQQQCGKLATLSVMIGRPRPELRADIRSCPFKGYTIFFRYLPDTVEIVNVLQGHRDIDAFFRQDPSSCTNPPEG
jgi:toxin ParE1/3/4